MGKRIVVKVGSNVLTREDGKLDVTRMSAIVDQIVWLKKHDYEVILVSSGAVAAGRAELHVDHHLDSVEQRQLFSAIGQVKLVGLYYNLFREYKIKIGQVLTMKENFGAEEQYKNQEACMQVMLENNVLPIVNENDTVCITELMFTDNDELSGLIAKMMNADTLILLSNVDGIYNGDPSEPTTRIIPSVYYDRDISEYILASKSSHGRGIESKDRPRRSQCRHQGNHRQRQYAKHPYQPEGASDGDPPYRVRGKAKREIEFSIKIIVIAIT